MRITTAIIASLACVSSAIAVEHTVTVSNTGFQPAQLCIQPGDKVQWFFAEAGHTVEETSAPGSCDSKNTWQSRVMNQGWRWSRSFKRLGVVSYKSGADQDCANEFKGTIYIGGTCPTTNETPRNEEHIEEVAPVVTPPSVTPEIEAQHTVTVSNTGFQPAHLCVEPGDGVNWYFADAGHGIQETTAPGSCDSKNTWRSAIMNQGWRWSRNFKCAGVVSYSSFTGQDCANGFKGTVYIGGNCPATNETPKDNVAPSKTETTVDKADITKNPSSSASTECVSLLMALTAVAVAMAAAF